VGVGAWVPCSNVRGGDGEKGYTRVLNFSVLNLV
jgi:hypothetical protein